MRADIKVTAAVGTLADRSEEAVYKAAGVTSCAAEPVSAGQYLLLDFLGHLRTAATVLDTSATILPQLNI